MESWRGQVFLNTNNKSELFKVLFPVTKAIISHVCLSTLPFKLTMTSSSLCFSQPSLLFTVTCTLVPWLYSWCQPDTPARSYLLPLSAPLLVLPHKYTEKHEGRWYLPLSAKMKFPVSGRTPPHFPSSKVSSEFIHESHSHYFALK